MDSTEIILAVGGFFWLMIEAIGWMLGSCEEYPYDDEM